MSFTEKGVEDEPMTGLGIIITTKKEMAKYTDQQSKNGTDSPPDAQKKKIRRA